MTVLAITDHADQAMGRLLQQSRGRPRVEALVRSIAASIQRYEDAIGPVGSGRMLFGGKAIGAQLDRLGELVGLQRNGAPDSLYLVFLLGTIARNNTDGSPARALEVARTVFQADSVFLKTPNCASPAPVRDPATVSLGVGSPRTPKEYWPICCGIVQDSLGAGVSIGYISSYDANNAFALAGRQGWVHGFSTLTGDGGGKMADLVFTNRGQ